VPLPKDVRFVSFDCYGTLIDWESGALDAYQKEADRDGFTIDRNVLIPLFLDIQHEIQGGSYELYAEVLRRTAIEIASTAAHVSLMTSTSQRLFETAIKAEQRLTDDQKSALIAVLRSMLPAE